MAIVPYVDRKGQKIANLYIDEKSGVFYLVKSVDGRTRFKSLYTKSLTVARARMAGAIKVVSEPEAKVDETPQVLLKTYWNDFMTVRANKGRKVSSLIRITTIWNKSLDPFWGRKLVTDCTQDKVDEFMAWHRENRPNIRFFGPAKYLNAFFKYLGKKGLIPPTDFPVLEIPMDEKKLMNKSIGRVPTEEEVEAALAVADDEMKLIIHLGYERGMRQMEIGSIHLSQIRKVRGQYVIHLDETKNGKERDVPVPLRAVPLLEKQIELTKTRVIPKALEKSRGYLFPRGQAPWKSKRTIAKELEAEASGKKLLRKEVVWHTAPQVIDRRWAAIKKSAKIEGRLRFHDLRHGAVHKFKRMGLDSLIACELLGMSIKQYQKVYGKLGIEDIMDSLKTFGGAA